MTFLHIFSGTYLPCKTLLGVFILQLIGSQEKIILMIIYRDKIQTFVTTINIQHTQFVNLFYLCQ